MEQRRTAALRGLIKDLKRPSDFSGSVLSLKKLHPVSLSKIFSLASERSWGRVWAPLGVVPKGGWLEGRVGGPLFP